MLEAHKGRGRSNSDVQTQNHKELSEYKGEANFLSELWSEALRAEEVREEEKQRLQSFLEVKLQGFSEPEEDEDDSNTNFHSLKK